MAVATLCGAPAGAVPNTKGWDGYGNTRFNFAICFPSAFHGQGEATNGDGQRFRSRDGAELAVFGSNEEPGTTLDAFLKDSVEDVAGKGARSTYRAQKRNWLVVSEVGPKDEFYVKRVRREDQMLTFELVYPALLHAKYAPLAAALVGCFTIGSRSAY
jgi:hypothetical protein